MPTGTTPPPHGKCINPSMKQLQIDLPPKPLRSGAPALHGPAASGAPNQEQAAQQRGGDGMDFDDVRSEISHPGSHPDSESSASSLRGNRGAPLHATSIGSSRPCQSPKIRPRVGGNHQAEIDSLLAQIVEEQQNEKPGAWHLVLSWTDIARKLNECGYVRENNLFKTSKYCRDRCETPYLVSAAPPTAPRPRAPFPQLDSRHSARFHRHTPSPAPFVAPSCQFASSLSLYLSLTPHDRACAPHILQHLQIRSPRR